MAVLVSTLVAGVFFGATLMGLSSVPKIARESQAALIRQGIRIDSLGREMKEWDARLDRLTCLMVSQYEETNPILCNKEYR